MFRYHFHINTARGLDAEYSMRWKQLSSQIFLNSLLSYLFLMLIIPSTIAYYLILDGWLDFRPPHCWPRWYRSLDDVSCSSWLDLFLSPISICLHLYLFVLRHGPWSIILIWALHPYTFHTSEIKIHVIIANKNSTKQKKTMQSVLDIFISKKNKKINHILILIYVN